MHRNPVPLRFVPRGVSDTLDGTNSPPGSMRSLSNLIPDPSTPYAYQCRPARVQLTDFTGFNTPGVVSAAFSVGGRIYGMIATARNAGKDEPFCYDVASGTFVAVTGVVAGNCPTTQATSGAWTPPAMDLMGVYMIVTHPGFPGGATKFGWFDLTNPAAPAWNAGDTTTNALTGVPVDVQQFNNRAYFAVGNTLQYTDALTLVRTGAGQTLTAGDSAPITTLHGLPISTENQGVLQALLAFKESTGYQVTGDPTTTNLAINTLNVSTGTLANRSVAATTEGVFFMAPDGGRSVALNGQVSDPNADLRVPFINALIPSRAASSVNNSVYRICVRNGAEVGTPYQDWWYDLTRDAWTGPHTGRYDIIVPYGSSFILADNDHPGKLYRSDVTQNSTSNFTEYGSALGWNYVTSPMADLGRVFANAAIESTINMALASGGQVYVIVAVDENMGVLSQASITAPPAISVWGAFTWGASIWYGAQYGLRPNNIPWTKPLVFTKLVVQISGPSSFGFKISNLAVMYTPLNYILPAA